MGWPNQSAAFMWGFNPAYSAVNVKTRGLVCDGVTDETQRLQRVLDDAVSGESFFIPGKIRITAPVSVSGKKISLLFAEDAGLIEGVPLSEPLLTISDADESLLYLPTVIGIETQAGFDYLPSDRVGIEIVGSSRVNVVRPTVTDKSWGMRLIDCHDCEIESPNIRGFITSYVQQTNQNAGIVVTATSAASPSTGNTVNQGTIRNVGIGVLGQVDTTRLQVNGTVIRDYFDNGVYISSGFECQVIGARISDGDAAGIDSAVKLRGSHHLALGCEIARVRTGIRATGNGAPDAFGANGHGTLIAENVIHDVVRDGIFLGAEDTYGSRNFSVCGNVLFNTATGGGNFAAIRVDSGDRAKIDGNVIEQCGGTLAALIFSWLTPAGAGAPTVATDAWITNNKIEGSASEGIRVQNLRDSTIAYNTGRDMAAELIDARNVQQSAFCQNRSFDAPGIVLIFAATCEENVVEDNWSDNGVTRNAVLAGAAHRVRMRSVQTPESFQAAAPGSTYAREDGGTGTSFYVKETGTGNTGWVAK